MNEHPYLDVIKRYLRGCGTGDIELMMSAFAEDIVVYLLDSDPLQGSEMAAKTWKKFYDNFHVSWTIDHILVQGNEAVIEYSMMSMSNREWFERGTEWIVFRGDKIAETRPYYDSRHRIPQGKIYELIGFPYKERGYPLREDFETHLP